MVDFWKRIFDNLQAEPPESDAWNPPGFEDFTNDLNGLVLKKRSQAAQALQLLGTALQALQDAPEWELYFRFSDIRSFAPHEFAAVAGPAIESFQQLVELLRQHRLLRAQHADGLDEEADLKRLENLAATRQSLYSVMFRVRELRADRSGQRAIPDTGSAQPNPVQHVPTEQGELALPGAVSEVQLEPSKQGLDASEAAEDQAPLSVAAQISSSQATSSARQVAGGQCNNEEPEASAISDRTDSEEGSGAVIENQDREVDRPTPEQIPAPPAALEPQTNGAPGAEDARSDGDAQPQTQDNCGEGNEAAGVRPLVTGGTQATPPEQAADREERNEPPGIDAGSDTRHLVGTGQEQSDLSALERHHSPDEPQPPTETKETASDEAVSPRRPAPEEDPQETHQPPHEPEAKDILETTNSEEPKRAERGDQNTELSKTEEVAVAGLIAPAVPRVSRIERLLWLKIWHGDISAAYWLENVMEELVAESIDSRLLELLVASCHAAQNCTLPGGTLARAQALATRLALVVGREEEREAFAQGAELDRLRLENETLRCLRTTAALPILLFEEEPLFYKPWFTHHAETGGLGEATERWIQFRSTYGPLTSHRFDVLSSFFSHRRAIRSWRDELQRQYVDKERADARKIRSLPAVIEHFLGDSSDLGFGSMVEIVERNLRGQRDRAVRLAHSWRVKNFIIERVKRVGDEIFHEDFGELRDAPLYHLVDLISTGCDAIESWAQWSEESGEGEALAELAVAVEDLIEDFRREADDLDRAAKSPFRPFRISVRHLQRTLLALAASIDRLLRISERPASVVPDLESLLRERLDWYPLDWTQTGHLISGQEAALFSHLRKEPPGFEEQEKIITECTDRWDFSRARRLFARSHALPAGEELNSKLIAAEKDAQGQIRSSVSSLEAQLLNRETEGFLACDDGELCRDLLGDAQQLCGKDPLLAKELLGEVAGSLGEAGRRAKEWARSRVGELQQKLTTFRLPDNIKAGVEQHAQMLLTSGDTLALEGYVTQAFHILDSSGDKLEESLLALVNPEKPENALCAFTRRAPELLEFFSQSEDFLNHIAFTLEEDGVARELAVSGDVGRAADGLKRWLNFVRSQRAGNIEATAEPVMAWLGFQRSQSSEVLPASQQVGSLLTFSLKYGHPQAPLPEYGSQRKGLCRLAVLTSYAEPEKLAGDLGARTWPDIILAPRPLDLPWRSRWADLCRRFGKPTLVVDSILFAFLLEQPEPRGRSLFAVAVPFASVNPYRTGMGDPVAPEMFCGRRSEVRRLLDGPGHFLLYGGRQLGKTAILNQVVRAAEIRSDMVVVFHSVRQDDPGSLWPMLDARLRQASFIRESEPRATPEAVVKRLIESFRSDSRTVLVLLDEVDDFLLKEAAAGWQNLNLLLNLAEPAYAGNQFRLILAGNYHIQRYDQTNSAPERFSRVIVGPMQYPDALSLVRGPLEAMGFRFAADPGESQAAIQRILYYTFSQAGLIQIFLNSLVDSLHKREMGPLPQYVVAADVDAVAHANNGALLSALRSRFHETLKIDTEYEIIFLSLLRQDGSDPVYRSAQDVLAILDGVWKLGIEELRQRHGQKLIERWLTPRLHEMAGLGLLLERSGTGANKSASDIEFRIRSRNLLALYQNSDRFSRTLDQLSSWIPPRPVFESVHDRVPGLEIFSPLTSAQRKRILRPGHRLTLVAGAPLSGLGSLRGALPGILPSDRPNEICEIPEDLVSGTAFIEWLQHEFQPNSDRGTRYLLHHAVNAGNQGDLAARVGAARAWLKAAATLRDVRVMFSLCPAAVLEWLSSSRTGDTSDSLLLGLEPWSAEAIRNRIALRVHDVSDEQAQSLACFVGGWQLLLDQIVPQLPTRGKFRRALEQAAARWPDLCSAGAKWEWLGIAPEEPIAQAIEFICQHDGVILSEWLSTFDCAGIDNVHILGTLEILGWVRIEDEIVFPDSIVRKLVCALPFMKASAAV